MLQPPASCASLMAQKLQFELKDLCSTLMDCLASFLEPPTLWPLRLPPPLDLFKIVQCGMPASGISISRLSNHFRSRIDCASVASMLRSVTPAR